MLKFLVFSDLHYNKKINSVTLAHLDIILKRAAEEKVDFVIQTGDFCTDYFRSPELIKAYQNNKYNLATYGIYGNHEMEGGTENTTALITPTLCNRPVSFGKEGESYWYTDIKNFRIIGLDTNYSFNPAMGEWEHNIPNSYGARAGNTPVATVHPEQFEWLTFLLEDAKQRKMKVLVFSHHTMLKRWYDYPNNANEVKSLLERYSGTVLMAINGDIHTDHFEIHNNVAYYDVNVVLWADWMTDPNADYPYPADATFDYMDFDENGNLLGVYKKPYNQLKRKILQHTVPLSAVVAVDEDGNIQIDGMNGDYLYSIAPQNMREGKKPFIPNRKAKINV